jgi:hypothetical protein
VYREDLRITGRTQQAGITLEAVGGATLETVGENRFPLEIVGVPDVTVRGFLLRATHAPRSSLVVVRNLCPGLRLERLDLAAASSTATNGIEVFGAASSTPAGPRCVIRECVFHGFHKGVAVEATPGNARVCTAVRDCSFTDCLFGVQIMGGAQEVQVVANRFQDMGVAAVQFLMLSEPADDLLVANNTIIGGTPAFRLWGGAIHGKNVRIRNNLVLANEGLDMLAVDAVNLKESRGPGDGPAVAAAYNFSHNWREGKAWGSEKGWIPPDPKKGDVLRDRVDGVNRDAKSPDFLRPHKTSDLASKGAGVADPSLPRYVGALPPEGVEPWDWDRAWRARVGSTEGE